LADVKVVAETAKPANGKNRYDRRYGETDLLEGELHRRSEVFLFGGLLIVLALACIGAVAFVGLRGLFPGAAPTPALTNQPPTQPAAALITNTPMTPPVMATVTLLPPTPTATPTPGPCTHKVVPGDDLISIAYSCGHRSQDVLPLILQMNNLSSASMIQIGQELSIPWPTATTDPNGVPASNSTTSADSGITSSSDVAAFFTATDPGNAGLELVSRPTQGPPTTAPTATLLPGMMWYTVKPNENIVGIAFENNTDVQVLSQLNPEITFAQCDFGNAAGGPECTVVIYAGQQIRVPAPTPTPTLSPTFSGSETATPTLTATFNAPSALSPADRALFMKNEFITLRWVASGTLSEGQTYRVRVEDTTTGKVYSSDTTDLSFILPSDWQGQDGQRHDYRWQVSVIRLADPDHPYFTTEPRIFTWEGR
ncbi:MAG: LysM peptidoglycan-binding domain-containing protein, partial [Chloroflexota bacterium]